MKTAKRNARTITIFNNVMNATTSMYCVQKKDMKLQEVYDTLKGEDGLVFHFLDTDGKVIHNTFGPNKDLINKGRRVSLVDSDNYTSITLNNKKFCMDIHEFKDNKLVVDSFFSSLIERIDSLSDSYFIRDLCKDYIQKAYQKNNYRALICFETIFGYQFLTRKQIDRIRYIYFSNDVIYDVLGGFYCFNKFLTERVISNLAGNIEVYNDINEILKWFEKSGVFHIIKECITDIEYHYDEDEVYDRIVHSISTNRTA